MQAQASVVLCSCDRRDDLDVAWLGLEPEGPVDLFLDDVVLLMWSSPLRFAGMLLLVVAGAAFLALVRVCVCVCERCPCVSCVPVFAHLKATCVWVCLGMCV